MHYQPTSDQPLNEAARAILLRGLREWLGAPEIELSLIQTEATEKKKAN